MCFFVFFYYVSFVHVLVYLGMLQNAHFETNPDFFYTQLIMTYCDDHVVQYVAYYVDHVSHF
jgi:hypothetical protein